MYIYTAIIVFNVTMICYQYHIIQKSSRRQLWWKQLVCLSKCFETSSLRSLNMKSSSPLLIEKKVMQPLSACLVWCTLLTEESAFQQLFWGIDNFSQEHLFLLLTDSLIFHHFLTLLFTIHLCLPFKADTGVSRSTSSRSPFTSFWHWTRWLNIIDATPLWSAKMSILLVVHSRSTRRGQAASLCWLMCERGSTTSRTHWTGETSRGRQIWWRKFQ